MKLRTTNNTLSKKLYHIELRDKKKLYYCNRGEKPLYSAKTKYKGFKHWGMLGGKHWRTLWSDVDQCDWNGCAWKLAFIGQTLFL